ncbi:MAG: hypothetical protein KF807_08135 [Xanthobacteraceae bacterium]|nr:hypothetical protein [Xanthobacteraceae bacterium]
MQISRRLLLQTGASALIVSPAFAQTSPGGATSNQFNLGKSWRVIESGANGFLWEGTWTRRGETNFFDAHWREVHRKAGELRDVIEFKSINGDEVQLHRISINGTYFGRLNAEQTKVVSGRASWYAAGDSWNANIIL